MTIAAYGAAMALRGTTITSQMNAMKNSPARADEMRAAFTINLPFLPRAADFSV
jgi:hypothetical protein